MTLWDLLVSVNMNLPEQARSELWGSGFLLFSDALACNPQASAFHVMPGPPPAHSTQDSAPMVEPIAIHPGPEALGSGELGAARSSLCSTRRVS